MPADITGTNVLVEERAAARVFRFQPGPIFANLVLADEINRATPKTQSALLEAMQEHRSRSPRQRSRLTRPFFVLATQNPIEMEGTYPLPEAQLDRFFFKLIVPFPSERGAARDPRAHDRRRAPYGRQGRRWPTRSCAMQRAGPSRCRSPRTSRIRGRVLAAQPPGPAARRPELVRQYVRYGAAPRRPGARAGGQDPRPARRPLQRRRRGHPARSALPALRHRLILNFEAEAEGITTEAAIRTILDSVAPPAVE